MLANPPLQEAVLASLERDPRIPDPLEIDDQLHVKLGPMDRREDDEIRAAALQKLIRDSEVPADSIDVSMRDGWVTLTGYMEYEPQVLATYDLVATLDGVTGISNKIRPLGY